MVSEEGFVRLVDGSTLKLKVVIADAREAGFSPYGGVNILVKPIAGLGVKEIPEPLKKEMANKPPITSEIPREGWEIIDIKDYKPASDELKIETSKGLFHVKVISEPVMAARNLKYKPAPELDEPIYNVSWVFKISWKPVKEVT